MPIRELHLTGTPYERGLQHGRTLRAEIHALYHRWVMAGARQYPPAGEVELLAFTTAHMEPACDFSSHWMSEVEGIAHGAELSVERAFLLSCWDELCSWFAIRSGTPSPRCTSFAVRPPASSDVMIGQNQDAWPWWRPVVVLHESGHELNEPSALYTAHPGVLATTGINRYGVAVVANSLVPEDRGIGAPFTFVVRQALAQPTMEQAIEVIVQAPRATGANYIVASTQGAADVETTAAHTHVTYVDDTFAHSNHYLSPELSVQDRGGPLLPDTYARSLRMQVLLRTHKRPLELEAVRDALADHDGELPSICRHGADSKAPDEMVTLGAVIAVPEERALYVTDGFPCTAPQERFTVVNETGREDNGRGSDR
ncbi:MAG: acyl-CoA--6-aminopenicillanic acid acyl-transferase [Chloroflexota bacterium]